MKCTLISTVGATSKYAWIKPLRSNLPGQREKYTGTLAGMAPRADTAQLQCEYRTPLVSSDEQPEDKLDDHGRETVEVSVEAREEIIKDTFSVLVEKRNLANNISVRSTKASIQSDILIEISDTLFKESISFVALEALTNNVEFVPGFRVDRECSVLLTQPNGTTDSINTKPGYSGSAVRFDFPEDLHLSTGGSRKLTCQFGTVDIKRHNAHSIAPIALMVGSNTPKTIVIARESLTLAGVKTNASSAVGLTMAVFCSVFLATIFAMF